METVLNYKEYYNKVLGGWIGKCAGGILGAPIEGFKRFNSIPYSDKLFETNFANDDLDLQVLWLDMLLKKGKNVRESDFKSHWLNHVEFPWCEYGIATKNMKLGLDNPDTGRHNNWYWNTGMGSPIRSEIWGMVNPGLPAKAAFYAGIDSRLDHEGFSVHAEQYLSACAAIAFFDNNVESLLTEGLEYIPSDSPCSMMVNQVFDWNKAYSFDIVAGKIKSRYGDADFTASPMNVAFIILSLLNSNNSFDFVIDALHLGHDSDCVVATAGALLGIILGYEAIPDVWKERVGDELLVSPEISGIYCPKTITELSALTCKAGVHFIENEENIVIEEFPKNFSFVPVEKKYEINTEVLEFPNPAFSKGGRLKINLENLTEKTQPFELRITSDYFEEVPLNFNVGSLSKIAKEVPLELNGITFPGNESNVPYEIEVVLNKNEQKTYKKGIPYYGNWLLLGPFIEDDYGLVPLNETYPDHGLPSLPSIQYMNHDKAKPEKQFLDTGKIQKLLSINQIFDQDFNVEMLYPIANKIDFGDCFLGMGERTVYLYSEIESTADIVKWLCIGSTAYLTVWHNGKEVYRTNELKRFWPMAHALELHFGKGKNNILIRLDVTLDDFRIEIGMKEHGNKHFHQSNWETNLQFNVSDNL